MKHGITINLTSLFLIPFSIFMLFKTSGHPVFWIALFLTIQNLNLKWRL